MGLLNIGTLNEELLSARKFKISCLNKKGITKAKGASTNQLKQRILFVSLIDYHSNSVFDLLRFHQFGNTALPGNPPNLSGTWRGRANLERSPYGSRP